MADLLQDMKSYLVAQNLVVASACFLDEMRNDPDSVVAIYEYHGGSSSLSQAHYVVRSMQIVVRDVVAQTARQKAQAIHANLLAATITDGIMYFTPTRWCLLHLRQVPFKIKIDDRDRSHYGFNVAVKTYSD